MLAGVLGLACLAFGCDGAGGAGGVVPVGGQAAGGRGFGGFGGFSGFGHTTPLYHGGGRWEAVRSGKRLEGKGLVGRRKLLPGKWGGRLRNLWLKIDGRESRGRYGLGRVSTISVVAG